MLGFCTHFLWLHTIGKATTSHVLLISGSRFLHPVILPVYVKVEKQMGKKCGCSLLARFFSTTIWEG